MELKEKVAIITGGSRGIGKFLAARFLSDGTRVVIAARTKNEILQTVEELKPQGEIIGLPADISKENEAKDLIDKTLSHFRTLDILVNAAGIQSPIGPLADVGIHDWLRTIHTNLNGTVLCSKAVLPVMIKKKRGKIINFSGGGANNSRPNFSAYGVSKAAVVRFTEILADELREFNIQVNAVFPGTIRTKMIDEILEAGPEKAGNDFRQVMTKRDAGFDSPEAVAELVCYLASEESDWISGKVISAVWDPWREWKTKGRTEIERDSYTLRRIDGRNYIKIVQC